jgi:signal transduction histidine kinase/ligand-binding sensor domain-containing protein
MRFRWLDLAWAWFLGGFGVSCWAQFQGVTFAPDSLPLRVAYHRYELDHRLSFLPPEPGKGVESLMYGAVITNFVRELPSVAGDSESPASRPLEFPTEPADLLKRYLSWDRWTTEHGLAGNKVRALLQSMDGYLWIGTDRGVTRFDGAQFTVLTPENTPGLTEAVPIRDFFEDDAGRIWIGTSVGLQCLATGKMVSFPGDAALREANVNDLAHRSSGGFWLATDVGLGVWDGHELRPMAVPGIERPVCLAESSSGTLWIASIPNALYQIDPQSGRMVSTRGTAGFQSYRSQPLNVFGMMMDRRGKPWLGWGELYRDGIPGTPLQVDFAGFSATAQLVPHHARFAEDRRGDVWATVESGPGGLVCFSDDPSQSAHLPLGVPSAYTSCILIDREDSIWVGGWNGLTRLRSIPFRTLQLGSNEHERSVYTTSVGADGRLWIGGDNWFAEMAGHELAFYDLQPHHISPTAICDGPFGSVWVGLRGGGILEIPGDRHGRRQTVDLRPVWTELGAVHALHAGAGGSLWVASANGLHHMTAPGVLTTVEGFDRADTSALVEDGAGSLWIGTRSGEVWECGPEGCRRHTLPEGVESGPIQGMTLDADGSLWVGVGETLLRFMGGRWDGFGVAAGLPDEEIHGVMEDTHARLWILHAAGVSRVARSELDLWLLDSETLPSVAHFGASSGISSLEGRGTSQPCARTADGRLWFARRNGVCVVQPKDFPSGTAMPLVRLETLLVDGEEVPVTGSLTLPAGSGRRVEIVHSVDSLLSPQQMVVRHCMEGYETSWHDSGPQRRARYSRLPPGRYQFIAQARNAEGRWGQASALFTFRIAPHFWQAWYFYPALAGVTAFGVAGWARWRLTRQRRRLEHERSQALERERTRIARDLHDHLGALLAETALSGGLSAEARLRLKQSLEELGDLIWLVSPENDSAGGWADFVSNYASRFLTSAGLSLELDVVVPNPEQPLSGVVRHELASMLKEALRNILQHARATRVWIRTSVTADQISLTIRDDGQGFDPIQLAEEPEPGAVPSLRGHGLLHLQARSSSLGGTCRFNSAPGKGTTVDVAVPARSLPTERTSEWLRTLEDLPPRDRTA